MKIKITSIVLCLFIIISVFSVGCGGTDNNTIDQSGTSSYRRLPVDLDVPGPGNVSGYVDSTVEYLPLTASDDGLLDYNPDRGFRTEFVLRIFETASDGENYGHRTVFADQSDEQIKSTIEGALDPYFKTQYTINKTFLAYIYITDYHDKDLSEGALRVIKIFFEVCRERKIKSMLRFCYNWSYAKNFNLSEENKQLLASECAREEIILKHIQQLKPVIAEYADTIHTISNGFIGYVGEWAYNFQYPVVSYPTVMKAIVENLCVPNGLYFSNRDPAYKNELIAEDPDYEYLSYISNNNDAMFGEQTNTDWYSGNYQVGRPEWQQVIDEGAYTPQDGEMFTIAALIETANGRYYNPRIPTGMQMILECAHHWHTSMSNWHSYIEAIGSSNKYHSQNIMLNWQRYEKITSEQLDKHKIIYDPNWFLNDKGKTVERNPYEFLRDHLGYKLVATKGHFTGNIEKGSTVSFELTLKNYGFAAAFMLESGFAILDNYCDVVSSVKAGEPDKWFSHDPENYQSTEVLEHSVKADLTLPEKSGKYYIAFYLKNTMDDRARLSNKLNYKSGYGILYEIDIK